MYQVWVLAHLELQLRHLQILQPTQGWQLLELMLNELRAWPHPAPRPCSPRLPVVPALPPSMLSLWVVQVQGALLRANLPCPTCHWVVRPALRPKRQ